MPDTFCHVPGKSVWVTRLCCTINCFLCVPLNLRFCVTSRLACRHGQMGRGFGVKKHMTNQISNTYMIREFRFPCRVGKGLVCQRNRSSGVAIYSSPYLLNDLQMQTVILSMDPSLNPACNRLTTRGPFSFCDLKSVCFANFYLLFCFFWKCLFIK